MSIAQMTKQGHIHGEDTLRLASPMHPAASFRCESKVDHVDHVFRGWGGRNSESAGVHDYVVHAPKLTTSKTFAPSSATLANSSPSALAETPSMGDMCAR